MQVNLNGSLAFYWLSPLTDSGTVRPTSPLSHRNPTSNSLLLANQSVAAVSLLSVMPQNFLATLKPKFHKNPTDILAEVCSVLRPSEKWVQLLTTDKMSVRETLIIKSYS